MSSPIITLTTDFGLSDPYVASLKGVILSTNPDAVIVDISHDIRPQRVEQGAFLLASALPYFPPTTIHVAVVDPTVGTRRRAIVLVTSTGVFVGPDNGILSVALSDEARTAVSKTDATIAVPPAINAYHPTDSRFHHLPVSATFHGRDIFAPIAAHLSLGVPPARLGPGVDRVVALPPFRARELPDGCLEAHVIHVDRFGNLVTSVRSDQLRTADLRVEVGGRTVEGLSATFADRPGLAALIGGADYLEIVLSGGSAARELAADIGEPLLARPATA
jgi:S-adenosylmethionine hydrolase